jgi:hypothetical protein
LAVEMMGGPASAFLPGKMLVGASESQCGLVCPSEGFELNWTNGWDLEEMMDSETNLLLPACLWVPFVCRFFFVVDSGRLSLKGKRQGVGI